MTKNLTCIICPKGCSLTADLCDGTVKVSGNGCKRGIEYAVNECLHPMRTVTLALRVANRPDGMLSVKTECPIPKDKMIAAAEALRALPVYAPISVGDVLAEDIFGSRIIATATMD